MRVPLDTALAIVFMLASSFAAFAESPLPLLGPWEIVITSTSRPGHNGLIEANFNSFEAGDLACNGGQPCLASYEVIQALTQPEMSQCGIAACPPPAEAFLYGGSYYAVHISCTNNPAPARIVGTYDGSPARSVTFTYSIVNTNISFLFSGEINSTSIHGTYQSSSSNPAECMDSGIFTAHPVVWAPGTYSGLTNVSDGVTRTITLKLSSHCEPVSTAYHVYSNMCSISVAGTVSGTDEVSVLRSTKTGHAIGNVLDIYLQFANQYIGPDLLRLSQVDEQPILLWGSNAGTRYFAGSLVRRNRAAPDTGWWWAPSLNGGAFFIEYGGISGNGIFIVALFYDGNGKPTWRVAMGPLSDSVFASSWSEVRGGQTLTGSYRAPTSASLSGGCRFEFTGPTDALMTRDDGTTIRLQRFSFTSATTPAPALPGSPQSGFWWGGASRSGTAFPMEIQASSLFGAALVYDADGDPVWYLATGGFPNGLQIPSQYLGYWDVYAGGPQLSSPEGSYSAYRVSSMPMRLTFADELFAAEGTLTMANTEIPIARFQRF